MSPLTTLEPNFEMIAPNRDGAHLPHWQKELRLAFTRVDDLWRYLELDPSLLSGAWDAARTFPLLVPRGFAALMEKGNPRDPLLVQVLPVAEELEATPGFSSDPVGDGAAACGIGLLKKYQGRTLVLATGACAVHCRYCFRRHFAYDQLALRRSAIPGLIETLGDDPELREVLLSGGDPLMLDDEILGKLIERLGQIPQIQRIRFHTRVPVVLPERITTRLCRILAEVAKTTVIVVQANHPRELRPAVRAGLSRLRQQNTLLLNQSVLLRDINDSVDVLSALSEALIEAGILPYYLHQLDPVQGAAHFSVSDQRARVLLTDLRSALPGYMVPRLVREIPGSPSKIPVF